MHRAEVLQLRGEWPRAVEEAQRACERLSGQAAVGAAHYQRAELHRLRGEFAESHKAYREASQWGREPQPGLALLRLAQGQIDAAAATARRLVAQYEDRLTRSNMLAAYVEIMLADGDVAAARSGADELCAIADDLGAPFLHAASSYATGAVLLAEGDPYRACETLRRALAAWSDVGAPYEAARTRVLIGMACRALGDDDSAEMELDGARSVFGQLGAAPGLAPPQERRKAKTAAAGLTAREVEVLVHVASGKTNAEIATELVVSAHTVRRHLQNIFAKLGVSSRAAATAFAFQHDLL